MQIKKNEIIYDLTANISESLVRFPGDPPFLQEALSSLAMGSDFHLVKFQFGNHIGTHIDFPSHVLKGGKTSNDYPIESLIGNGIIIKVPDNDASITKQFIQEQNILQNDFVFFKTTNSLIPKNSKINTKYVYIDPAAAEALVRKGVKIVGIDYLSVDAFGSTNLPVHKTLLSKDVLIVGGLELKGAPEGRCMIYIMPIKIDCMDGLPARVIAKKVGRVD